jgi:hypothetical protein
MQFKKHIRRIARVGQKASFNFAKRLGKKVAAHALIGGGTAIGGLLGTALGGPAGTAGGALVGGAFGHELASTIAGEHLQRH